MTELMPTQRAHNTAGVMISSSSARPGTMNQPRVLIVDDDSVMLLALPDVLRLRMGEIAVDTADSAVAALNRMSAHNYDAIITDIKMPGMDGLSLLAEIRTRQPEIPTLLLTGYDDYALAVQALRGGAYDFIQKPIDREYLVASLRQAIQTAISARQAKQQQMALGRHVQELQRTVEERTRELQEANRAFESPLRWLISRSQQMKKVAQQIRQVAGSPLSVIVEGETGTGKELTARAIHQLSARCKKPFVAVDCGAIPDTLMESELFGYEKGAFTGAHQRKEGRFQMADGGSLFFDEMANVPLPIQAKLLRVLEERAVQPLGCKQLIRLDVRLIAASNVPLAQEVRAGRFRQDLYYRLNEFVITLPPLRGREDILDLANDFLAEASMEFGRPCREISEGAAEVLLRYHWPGNVRELRNVIRRAILLASDVIEADNLSFLQVGESPTIAIRTQQVASHSSLKEVAEAAAANAEQQAIRQALEVAAGNKSEAARLLQTDYKTLYLKIRQYGIDTNQFKQSPAQSVKRAG